MTNLFACLFRSEEIVRFTTDLRERDEIGQILTLPRSKANQVGAPERIKVRCSKHPSRCPVLSMDRYLSLLEREGPIFRPIDRWGHVSDDGLSPKGVTYVMKRGLQLLGLSPDEITKFASHSGRRSGITWRILANRSRQSVKEDARIKRDSTLDKYIWIVNPWYDVAEDTVL